MASLSDLEKAFIAADDAGNHEDAAAFAAEISRMRSAQPSGSTPHDATMAGREQLDARREAAAKEPFNLPAYVDQQRTAAQERPNFLTDPAGYIRNAIDKSKQPNELHPMTVPIAAGTARMAPAVIPGGPVGALANAGGEYVAQKIEGRDDPGAMNKAAVIGAVPFGKAAGIMGVVKNALRMGGAGAVGEQVKSLTNTGELASAGDTVKAGALPAGLGLAVPALGSVAAKITGRVSPEDVARVAASKSQNRVEDATLSAIQKEGGAIRPSRVNDSKVNKLLESAAGPTALEHELSIQNAPVINKVARREASVAPNEAMDAGVMNDARDKLAAPYQEIRAFSEKAKAELGQLEKDKFTDQSDPHGLAVQKNDPATVATRDPLVIKASADIDALGDARRNLKDAWSAYHGSPSPEAYKAAQSAKANVDRLESNIQEAAKSIGDPELLKRLKASREAIAKNRDIEDAINPGNADVVAPVLARMMKARGEGSMTGGSKDIAKFASAFPDEVRPRAGINNTPSAVTAGTSLLAASSAGSAPAALLKGGIPFLRGPIRAMIKSPAYQAKYAKRDYTVPTSADSKQVEAVIRALINRQNEQKK